MKTSLTTASTSRRWVVLLLIAAAGVAITLGHAQSASGVIIGVRSGIDPAEKAKRDRDPAYAQNPATRGQVYVLASIKESTQEMKLIKPVDALAMVREVKRQLQKQGFREAGMDDTPDVILTVIYARGYVPNPYINPDLTPGSDPRLKQRVGLSDDDPLAFTTHEVFVGLEAKAQALSAEKLIIQIRAWKYPPPPDAKEELELAWMTTMYADDPDHRDLNLVMPQMLANGAPYFNQHLDRERPIEINTDYPEGHVNVGTPEVVAEPKK